MSSAEATTTRRRPRINPVLRRELVERWRGRRAFLVLSVYLGVLVGLALVLAWVGTTWAQDQAFNGFDTGPVLGRFLFENVFALVLLLVLFVGPGYAAAQISGERERRTLGLLQITLVTPWRIVLGKLGAAAAWLLLLVLTAAPLGAVAFFLGGVTVSDLLRGVLYLVLVTVAMAAIGIGVSAVVRKTTAAIVITYGVVLTLLVGTLFAALVEATVTRTDRFGGGPPATLQIHPFVGLADATQATPVGGFFNGPPSILSVFAAALPDANEDRFAQEMAVARQPVPLGDGLVVGRADAVEPGAPALDQDAGRRPVWLLASGLYGALGFLGLIVAARRVRPGHGPRRRRNGAGRGAGPERTVTAAGWEASGATAGRPGPGAAPPPPTGNPVDPPPGQEQP